MQDEEQSEPPSVLLFFVYGIPEAEPRYASEHPASGKVTPHGPGSQLPITPLPPGSSFAGGSTTSPEAAPPSPMLIKFSGRGGMGRQISRYVPLPPLFGTAL